MSEEVLQKLCPFPLQVTWHENKSTYLSFRKEKQGICLRVHRLFYSAPPLVLEALIRYVLKPQDLSARALVRQVAHAYFSENRRSARPLESRGKVYDLQLIFNRLLSWVPIEGVSIGWSPHARPGKFRSLTFGAYDRSCRQIRINPLLDDAEVPLYFVEFIVYHEMLHALCPAEIDSLGRCFVHTAEFQRRERQFPHYKAAKQWAKKSLMFFKKRKRSDGRS